MPEIDPSKKCLRCGEPATREIASMGFCDEHYNEVVEHVPAEQKAGKFSIRVSEKGAVSVYGLRRFPITLYAGEWEKLFAESEEIKKFIAANSKIVARKTK